MNTSDDEKSSNTGWPSSIWKTGEKLNSMSAHADRGEILRWLGAMPAQPSRLFLVHGEPKPMDSLKALVRERLGWDAHTPSHGETVPV